MSSSIPWETVIPIIRESLGQAPLPSVSEIALRKQDPFRILVSTMISLRTKDEVTSQAADRLFAIAETPAALAALPDEEIARLIYPAGFYRTKAKNIRRTAAILLDEHGGIVPADREALLQLPGVGVKTANLTLNLGFGIEAICVDTHVHRISNRTGWVSTGSPEETEIELMKILPRRYWIEINELLVRFGQTVCTPTSPYCKSCRLKPHCRRVNVTRSRNS